MTVEQLTMNTRLYTLERENDFKEDFKAEDKLYTEKRLEKLETIKNYKISSIWLVSYYLIDIDTMEAVLTERRKYKTRNAAMNQFRKY